MAVALSIGILLINGGSPASAATTGTIVSLTFDDANADQMAAASTMNNAGLKGTFYLVSGFIGAQNYMTLGNVQTLAAAGNEIAGHTVTHPDLATLSTAEATRQVCNDRVNWANWGYSVTDFAYPFASATSATETVVKNCGYNSARGLGDIKTRFDCGSCPVAEKIPPADPYYTQAPDEVETTWTLADLQKSVTQAEAKNNGGWVELTFHHICTGSLSVCPDPSTTPTIFNQFIAWLAPRAKTNNTVVKTVSAVIGGTVKPVVAGPVVPPAAPGVNAIQNASLETADATSGLPQCFLAGGYGSNTAAFKASTDAHTGKAAETLTMTNYSNGDAKLLPTLDLGQCSPTVTVGHTYTLGEWYKSTVPTQFAVYYRGSNGLWNYWTSSPWFASTATYAQASWVTPAIPTGATALSFGLNLFSNGTLTTDDFSMYDGAAPSTTTAVQNRALTVLQDAIASSSRSTSAGTAPAKAGTRARHQFTLPAADPTHAGKYGKSAKQGHTPGDVTLKPFVVSPELLRG